MNILICDDDIAFAERLEKTVVPFFVQRGLPVGQCTVCADAQEALAASEAEAYRLAFLDVQLTSSDGIALGFALKQRRPELQLVYISAYLEFALQGYTVDAFRYILKSDLARTLPACLDALCGELQKVSRVLDIKVNRETRSIPYNAIFSLESDRRRILVVGEDPDVPLAAYYGKLSELPQAMLTGDFLRISRSAVVNMRATSKSSRAIGW